MIIALTIIGIILILMILSIKETVPDEIETSAVTKPFYKASVFLYRHLIKKIQKTSYYRKLYETKAILSTGNKTEKELGLYLIKKTGLCLIILFFGMALTAVIDYKGNENEYLENGNLLGRKDEGEKDYKVFLSVNLSDKDFENNLTDYEITVKSREYTDEELNDLLPSFTEKLEESFLGDNDSCDFVTRDVILTKAIKGYPFTVTYEWGEKNVIDRNGKICDGISDEGSIVVINAVISYGNFCSDYSFAVNVFPKDYTKEELTEKMLSEAVLKSAEDTKFDEYLTLPTEIDGISVTWSEKKQNNSIIFLLMTLFAFVLFFIGKDRDMHKDIERRNTEMTDDYPEIVSKLTLYTGAGMSIRNAWKKISLDYKEKRDGGMSKRYAYEEMLQTLYEMESGVEETVCYSHFSKRAGVRKYVKLVSLLDQNIKTGSKGLCSTLKAECDDAFEERKSIAEKKGEEAGTKLLAPMMLMLMVVMVIIMVPAFTSM